MRLQTHPNNPKAKTGKAKKKKKEYIPSYGRKQRKRSSGGQDNKSDSEQQTKTLQEKSKLEMDNSVFNPSGNGIPDGLETEFSVFKTLVSNCVRLNSVSDQRPNRDGINSVSDQRPN